LNTPSPDLLQRIVVPIRNPHSAVSLLRLATAMVDPTRGRVIALYISLDDDDDAGTPSDALHAIIQQLRGEEQPVELMIHPASGIARGILDVTREVGADLLLLGVEEPQNYPFDIGIITHNLVETAPCEIMIYMRHDEASFSRIVVPMDGSEHARVASKVALRLSQAFAFPMMALIAQREGHSKAEGQARIERTLVDLPGAEAMKREVVYADDPVEGLLENSNASDLILIGFTRREVLQRWLFSRFSERLLRRTPSSVILTSAWGSDSLSYEVRRRLSRLIPTLTEGEQDELEWQAEELSQPSLDYWVLMGTGAVIASAGLLLNSPALIIGAMLVAPLKRPITTFSIGLTTGRVVLIRRALVTILFGVILSLLIGLISGRLQVVAAPTDQMQAWSQPTLTDAVIALAAGVVGAYASARKNISDSLAGVAIATSLEPAVANIGLGAATGNLTLSLGAALLFVTNIVCIILAGWAVYFWMGMRPRAIEKSRRRQYTSWALVMLMLLPVLVVLLRLTNRESASSVVNERLEEAFAPAEVVEMRVEDGDTLDILATVRSSEPITARTVEIIQNTLSSELQQPVKLRVIVQTVIEPAAEMAAEATNSP
jgi:uncharacterized hydrophobic protein (TIGR00271 family)